MEKLIGTCLFLIVIFTIIFGFKAISDLNDGRVSQVVQQILAPHVQSVNASEKGVK